jgi:hypothetical protein
MDHATFTAEGVTALTNEIPKKTTAAVAVLATIATADLTAAKFVVHVEYTVGS